MQQKETPTTWLGMSLPEMRDAFLTLGLDGYRDHQMADWLYKKGVTDFAAITNFSLGLRQLLAETGSLGYPEVTRFLASKEDPVWKALLTYDDTAQAECVLMSYSYGNSVCLSTQVGCRMSCLFCASGSGGWQRNLSAGEILAQILILRRLALPQGEGHRVSHLVLMGMGEPLDNFEQVHKALTIANASWGLGISYRNITLSTIGLVPQMEKLRHLKLPLNLSLSLHAPDDTLRHQLVPGATKFSISEVLGALWRYVETTRRRATVEYCLISGVNDSASQARELARLLKGHLVHLNLIPYNPPGSEKAPRSWQRSSLQNTQAFTTILQEAGVTTTLRREMGSDISAACGQLRQMSKSIPAAERKEGS
ncbi:MAG: 23S rRNA (adenine(2503)-C(2))-methyltransferase RlmN [Symbiobacteriaceae bacterium]|nr:23S rRNA (adenine(2503)-C(2))-methyltransferase RlmN [Symbiobacteriaceae bacterium]